MQLGAEEVKKFKKISTKLDFLNNREPVFDRSDCKYPLDKFYIEIVMELQSILDELYDVQVEVQGNKICIFQSFNKMADIGMQSFSDNLHYLLQVSNFDINQSLQLIQYIIKVRKYMIYFSIQSQFLPPH